MTATKKHRVGILLSDLKCSKYLVATIDALRADPAIELVLILEHGSGEKAGTAARLSRKLSQAGPLRFASLMGFAAMKAVETRFASAVSGSVRDHFKKVPVDESLFAGRIDVTPEYSKSGLYCRYGEADLVKLETAALDIMVRGNTGAIYKGRVLKAARLGIISFHHGDNRWNRGVPPAFWEVYLRKPSTGFIVQILSEELDGGKVLYRGGIVTKRTYTQNLVELYRESSPFLALVTWLYLNDDPSVTPEQARPFSGTIRKYPRLDQVLAYAAKTFWLHSRMAVERKLLGREQRWGVAYTRRHWSEASLAKSRRIANPKHRFLADPFVLKRDGRHYIFAEDYDKRRKLGAVSCIVVEPDDSYRIIDNILVEPFHLSFPLVFEEGGQTWMMPETAESGTIRIYRCVEFPHRWELHKEIVRDVSATDTIPVRRDGKWFLLSNVNQFNGDDHLSQFHVLWSDDLFSTSWTRLSPLPLINDPRIGRSAGFLHGRDGDLYRVRQRQGFNLYGAGFSIARVTRLDTGGYAEEAVAEITPEFFPGITSTHHMHGVDDFTVFDFAKTESYG